ncbi:MAG: diguanylate cyclase, partial [Acidobacteria bacterium]|nr:diguanylate cyclase [Acidobacteriota bacterium]
EKLIGAVRAARWGGHDAGDPGRVTVSVGVAEFPGSARSAADLLRAADQALYGAKRAGKDRVGGPDPVP